MLKINAYVCNGFLVSFFHSRCKKLSRRSSWDGMLQMSVTGESKRGGTSGLRISVSVTCFGDCFVNSIVKTPHLSSLFFVVAVLVIMFLFLYVC